MVFNELSLETKANDIPTAREWMSELIQTIRQAIQMGIKRELRASEDLNFCSLANQYTIAQWRNDENVEKEEKQFFRSLSTKTPLIVDIIEDIQDKFELSDICYQGKKVQGLGFALIIDGIAISFKSDSQWICEELELNVIRLEQHSERLIDKIENVKHISCRNHIIAHKNWIIERIQTQVINGKQIWEQRENLFPNLQFCDSVKKQLEGILKGQPELIFCLKTLLSLQDCSKNWNDGYFNVDGTSLDESGESEATLNKYKDERTFICPDGEALIFSRHIKLKVCNWRIHFFPKYPGLLIIGYIGTHLPTVKYKT